MRGSDQQQSHAFSYISPEQRVRKDHPLWPIRVMVDEILKQLSPQFNKIYAKVGWPSIPPEQLLRARIIPAKSLSRCNEGRNRSLNSLFPQPARIQTDHYLPEGMMNILLAVDDSKFSEAAAQAVLRQARPQDTEVLVLSVMEPSSFQTASGNEGYYAAIDAALQEATNRSEALVAKTAELLRSKGFKVTSSVTAQWSDPRTKIIDVAAEWGADLIVLGSHGRSGLNRFLMGSVSEAVARNAPCSVEIVRIPRVAKIGSSAMATDDRKKCAHPPCTCRPRSGKYCSAQCEAMEERPEIDCRCGHPDCRGKAH